MKTYLNVCYLISKDENADRQPRNRLQEINDKLIEAQDYYEAIGSDDYYQAFVFGNGEALIRPFTKYHPGFRAAFDDRDFSSFSLADQLVLAYTALKKRMAELESVLSGSSDYYDHQYLFRLVILSDMQQHERVQEEKMAAAINKLKNEAENNNFDFKVCFLDVERRSNAGCLSSAVDSYECK